MLFLIQIANLMLFKSRPPAGPKILGKKNRPGPQREIVVSISCMLHGTLGGFFFPKKKNAVWSVAPKGSRGGKKLGVFWFFFTRSGRRRFFQSCKRTEQEKEKKTAVL